MASYCPNWCKCPDGPAYAFITAQNRDTRKDASSLPIMRSVPVSRTRCSLNNKTKNPFTWKSMKPEQIYKIIETIVLALLTCCAVALGMTSFKAWRTISTTATYTQVTDSAKVATTIATKTVEEYQGKKK